MKKRKKRTVVTPKLPEYKCSGEYKNKAGEWSPLSVTLWAANEKVARVRATAWLHKIKKVELVGKPQTADEDSIEGLTKRN